MPYSAPTRCSDPSCSAIATHRGRCDEHQRPAWQGRKPAHERYGISGSARAALHKRILQRDGYRCYIDGLPGATEVDHIIPVGEGGSRTDEANLAAIHAEPCHLEKTQREAARARARAAARRAARRDG